jgi:hypothetical protein
VTDQLTEENFWSILASTPTPKPIYYRLYYNDSGLPLFYSHEEQLGKYIDVTPEQFALNDPKVRVVNGILVPYQPPTPKLRPSDTGTACHPSDVSIVVSAQDKHQKWRFGTNEQD